MAGVMLACVSLAFGTMSRDCDVPRVTSVVDTMKNLFRCVGRFCRRSARSSRLQPKGATVEPLEPRQLLSGSVVHTTAQLSQARFGIGMASAGGKALFFGGGVNAITGTSAADLYDSATGTWSQLTGAPQGTTPFVFGIGDTFYFRNVDDNVLTTYDTSTRVWGSIPAPAGYTEAFGAGGHVVFTHTRAVGDPVVRTRDGVFSIPASIDRGDNDSAIGTELVLGDARLTLYDTLSGQTKIFLGPDSVGLSSASSVAVGSKLVIIGNGQLFVLDTITGRDSVVTWPTDPRGGVNLGLPATVLGSKIVFARAQIYPSGSPMITVGEVYDTADGTWSSTPPTAGVQGVTAGDKALFSNSFPYSVTDVVDVYTDTSPTATLSGGVKVRRGKDATVIVTNTGDASVSGPYTVEVYVASPGKNRGAVPVGSVRIAGNLAPGETRTVKLTVSLPTGSRDATYHYVAMLRDANGVTHAFAGSLNAFTVAATNSATADANATRTRWLRSRG